MKKKKNSTLEVHVPVEIKRSRIYLAKIPRDEHLQNELGEEMMIWVTENPVFVLADFPISKNMSPARFYRIAEHNEYFAGCLDFARHTISSRLHHGWKERSIDRDYAMRMLAIYDDEYRSITMQKHKIVEEARLSAAAATFNITIPPIPAEGSHEQEKK